MDMTPAVLAMQDALAEFHGSKPIRLPDGTLAIQKQKPTENGLFQDGYLHEFYAPLGDADLDALQHSLGRSLTDDMRSLYKCTNGFSLFCGSISFGGYRKDNRRALDQRLPISLRYGNVVERLAGESSEMQRSRFVFGFYAINDGYALSQVHEEIELTPRRNAKPVFHTWPNLGSFLNDESQRLMLEFSRSGSVDPLNVLSAPL